ncbi:hypothetical protein A2313_00520 [Candidatus Roizmanbacteria bacterium RIFOXYB2_FULL_41_10]|uniref:Peptidase M20 dimerisation domain-containing protein n=1 Tax=Candidatus Roizmanbacteria bacterium RIFOXYA1_FULL_41_12 TaxID=1802082 RepID=A0A1F7KAI9_9BACT|nr:MAG: hypothetical protein A2209_04200 [Candidatus Roizmanbacteria bacterium RIFOXYA1_FULL_41_12]OGK66865.1 MAG: hypothetical protein A2377_03125 [Candidatus Roizmanbacteria bacterium RIFOXYB1_FULL_41_27]OGK70761.1 MAG: hypothetical protein A2403_01580 [Candidatus Roizmanbacteria bacterium RIFOXYC1_FULL_41_16]OGK71447.1 MAG: hypothetical protein A2313_00520 [Candidatus Roizmanbacteria bacterium RIFOXYB2_FULL_41_10]OGK75659.1 MAG: hypothetical protein A2575_03115 [Candidatus Roizmanbacteria ba
MLKNIIELTKKLVQIPSIADKPEELKRVLETALKEVSQFSIERFYENNNPSAIVYSGKKRPDKFRVILSGHLDVVPGHKDQYQVIEKNGRLYGRGTDDMKAGCAAIILLFKELADKLSFPLGLQLTTDEETGGFAGVKHQVEKGIKTEFFLTAESTQLNIKNEAKGVIWGKVTAKGSAAHSAYLWNGNNAAWKIKAFLNKLEQAFPVPKKETWQTTVNLSLINTPNQTFNKVPDKASAGFDCRYIPADRGSILAKLKSLVPNDLSLEILENESFHYCSPKSEFISKLSNSINKVANQQAILNHGHGASDARHYSAVGTSAIEFGPIGNGLHSDDEWVDTQSLLLFYNVLKEYLLGL